MLKFAYKMERMQKGEADSSASPEGSFVYSCVPLSSTLARVTCRSSVSPLRRTVMVTVSPTSCAYSTD